MPGVLNDSQRAELAKKLDEDLNEFIDTLAEKKDATQQKKEFNFDEWCKEIDEHPAFMTSLKPDSSGIYSEAVQALQALKYDNGDSEEDIISTANQHKLEGNKHFKLKKYRWASDCYTNGIKLLCVDQTLNSELFANRAAAQKRLGNLRIAVRDCVFSRRFNPHNFKALIRAAECLIELGYGKKCIEWIESSIKLISESPTVDEKADNKQFEKLLSLKELANQCALREERNLRKIRREQEKDLNDKKQILSAFKKRKLLFKPFFSLEDASIFEWSFIEVRLPQTQQHQRVYLDDVSTLHWPLLIQYPEAGQTDLLTECCEQSTLEQLLKPIFNHTAEWDLKNQFRPDNVRLFVSLDTEQACELNFSQSLAAALSTEGFLIVQGLPVIQVYTRKRCEESFELIGGRRFMIR